MSDIAIKAENIGKMYTIGHEKKENYVVLRDVVANTARQIARKTREIFKGGQLVAGDELEEFWALKDIDFEIKKGDRFGVIGRNGAGKSTLLKVLSRITEPTTGSVKIKGVAASLLEVGTGFHPELSGRENIYLNGAILGMSRADIKRKFDEIVDFSGVENFLDTPVKRYSSGMYVRLAFSVAAHLESEILIVDEVLAVGDAEFQKKCLGKMNDVTKNDGRTVLFVSHNLSAIRNLCNKGILLEGGKTIYTGGIDTVIDKYINTNAANTSFVEFEPKPEKVIAFTKGWLTNDEGEMATEFDVQKEIIINFEFLVAEDISDAEISIVLTNSREVNVLFCSLSETNGNNFVALTAGKYEVSVRIKENYLVPDNYLVRLRAHQPDIKSLDAEDQISFIVNETGSTLARYALNAKHLSCVMGGSTWGLKKIN